MYCLDSAPVRAAMGVPVTATTGSTGPLLRKLQSLMAQHSWPEGVNEVEFRRLRDYLEDLCIYLQAMSDSEDSSLTAMFWMKEVRELCFDAEDYFDESIDSERASGFSELVARAEYITRRRIPCNHYGMSMSVWRLLPEILFPAPAPLPISVGPMNKVLDLLALDQKELTVVPIFGSAGLGKTTIARSVYDQLQHTENFHCRAFVRVTRDPDMRKLLNGILSQIKAPRTVGYPDVQELTDRIYKHLQGKRYLIVIDDLWTSSAWYIISRAFPDGDYFSRIVTTTEIFDVALACGSYYSDNIYEMPPLNDDQSRELLFSDEKFVSEWVCPMDFKEVSAEIIRRCGGLAFATMIVAKLLELEGEPFKILNKMKYIRDSLPSTSNTNPSKLMKEVLKLVYNHLPPSLRTCLLYLSMYPEGHTIWKHDLARQFVAEGFVGASMIRECLEGTERYDFDQSRGIIQPVDMNSDGQSLEDTAGYYADQLVSRGIIQPVDMNYDGEVLSYTVHHIVLDFIRDIAKEENFNIIVHDSLASLSLTNTVRRLSIQFGCAKGADIPEMTAVSQVRSLAYYGFSKCAPPVAACRLVRVLVLNIWADQGKDSFGLRIAELFHLKYLTIQCNIIVELPDKIQGLQSLETLEVNARLSAIPSDIGHLEKLQHLLLPAEDNLGNLGNKKCLDLVLFKKLNNLKSVILSPASSSEMNALNNASASSITISDSFSMVSPPPLIQRLELSWRCYIFSNLPEWTKELTKLCILKIAVGQLLTHDIHILGNLPSLTALSLYVQTTPAEWIVFGKAGYSVLRYFKFRCTAPLLKFEEGTMPNLRKLRLLFNGTAVAPVGIEHLSGLEEISAEIGGAVADAESNLRTAVSKHSGNPRICVQLMDQIVYGGIVAQDENKVEDQKKQVDRRSSTFLEPSWCLPVPELEMRRGVWKYGAPFAKWCAERLEVQEAGVAIVLQPHHPRVIETELERHSGPQKYAQKCAKRLEVQNPGLAIVLQPYHPRVTETELQRPRDALKPASPPYAHLTQAIVEGH